MWYKIDGVLFVLFRSVRYETYLFNLFLNSFLKINSSNVSVKVLTCVRVSALECQNVVLNRTRLQAVLGF